MNIVEKRYSNNNSDDISKLYMTLSDESRREKIKENVNNYQAQLTLKNLSKLLSSDLYKETVLGRFSTRSESLESSILDKKSENILSSLLQKYVSLSYYKRIFRAKDHKFSSE